MSFLSMPHFSALGWLAVVGGALAVGLNKGGLLGVGILPLLLFALVIPARASTGFILPLLLVGDVCAVVIYRRVVIWRVVGTLLPPAVAGVVVGFAVMGILPVRWFGPLIGWIILILIAVQLARGAWGEKLDRFFASRGFGLGMGLLAGVTTMIANAAGPVANLYFLSVGLPKWNLIGTSAWFFFIINLTKLPFSATLGLTNPASLTLAVFLAPLVIIGFFVGRKLAAIMPQIFFERFLLVCTAIGALRLIG